MSEIVALDTNFIISILIKRNNTERALNILSGAIECKNRLKSELFIG